MLPSMATTLPIPIILSKGGFPMFADMNWGDLFTAAWCPAGKPSATNVDANSTKTGSGTQGNEIKAERMSGQGRGKGHGTVGLEWLRTGQRGVFRAAQAGELMLSIDKLYC